MRVGYAIGPAWFISAMRNAGGPYAVAGPSIAAVQRALQGDDGWVAERVTAVRAQRNQISEMLRSIGAVVGRSEANFILARLPRAEWLIRALSSLGIAVRGYEGHASLADAVRMSCPGDDSTDRITLGVEAALQPGAIVMRVDRSWPELADVFDRAVVARIASRVPLGLITRLPRRDAEARLAQLKLLRHLPVIVSGEDDPNTDTAAIRLALERLSVRSAWMVCSSEDDMIAARAARVVPIVSIGPGECAAARDRWMSLGAAAVLDRLEDLEGLLP